MDGTLASPGSTAGTQHEFFCGVEPKQIVLSRAKQKEPSNKVIVVGYAWSRFALIFAILKYSPSNYQYHAPFARGPIFSSSFKLSKAFFYGLGNLYGENKHANSV